MNQALSPHWGLPCHSVGLAVNHSQWLWRRRRREGRWKEKRRRRKRKRKERKERKKRKDKEDRIEKRGVRHVILCHKVATRRAHMHRPFSWEILITILRILSNYTYVHIWVLLHSTAHWWCTLALQMLPQSDNQHCRSSVQPFQELCPCQSWLLHSQGHQGGHNSQLGIWTDNDHTTYRMDGQVYTAVQKIATLYIT